MFCPRCGWPMEGRRRVFGSGVVYFTFGCVRCNRAFLASTPRVKMMDDRFKLCESVLTWEESRKCTIVSLAEAKRRTNAWAGKRMRQRCVPRFCPQCGTLLDPLREHLEAGRPRTVYGCPSRKSCNKVYVQPGKYFMQLAEAGNDWVKYKRVCVRQNRRLRRVGRWRTK